MFFEEAFNVCIFFTSHLLGSSISDTKKLKKLIKKADSMLGTALELLQLLVAQTAQNNEIDFTSSA